MTVRKRLSCLADSSGRRSQVERHTVLVVRQVVNGQIRINSIQRVVELDGRRVPQSACGESRVRVQTSPE